MGSLISDTWREHWMKALVAIAGSIATYLASMAGGWVRDNVVLAADLNGLEMRIGKEIERQVAPIIAQQTAMARQQAVNSLAICTARKATLKNAIRGTKVQIEDMRKEKAAKPQTWGARDQLLLEELENDLDAAQTELEALACRDSTPPQ